MGAAWSGSTSTQPTGEEPERKPLASTKDRSSAQMSLWQPAMSQPPKRYRMLTKSATRPPLRYG